MSEKQPHPITLPVETRHLNCPLTDEKKKELHDTLLSSTNEKKRLEEHKKYLVSSTAATIKEHEKKIRDTADALTQGFEMRPVAVVKKIQLNQNAVQFIRQDTGTVIEERALTGDERHALLTREGTKDTEHMEQQQEIPTT